MLGNLGSVGFTFEEFPKVPKIILTTFNVISKCSN